MESFNLRTVLWFFMLVLIANSHVIQTADEASTVTEKRSETASHVCNPQIVINQTPYGRPTPTFPGPSCNCRAIQEMLASELNKLNKLNTSNLEDVVLPELRENIRQVEELQEAVSDNQKMVSSELRTTTQQVEDASRQVRDLQVAVADNQRLVISTLRTTTQQLEETSRQVGELEEGVETNREMVASDLGGIKHQLGQLQVAVLGIVRFLNNTHGGSLVPKDCSEALALGVTGSGGVYKIQPLDSGGAVNVYCDMETDGGGWTVFQRRQDGSVDFYRDFANYSRGFGDLEGEFWLGNDNLHRLTAQGEYELRVDLSDIDNDTAYAVFDSFSIADGSDNYRLTVGAYSGTAGDALSYNNNHNFSTKDRDNDGTEYADCAEMQEGAWWYNHCSHSNLNGRYISESSHGITWYRWKSNLISIKYSDMKFRKKI